MDQKVLAHCRVKVATRGLPAERAVAESLAEYGPGAKLAVISKGPTCCPT